MSQEIVDAIGALEQEKGIAADTLMDALSDALLSAYKKTPGAARYARVELDPKTADFRVFELIVPEDIETKLLDEQFEDAIKAAEAAEAAGGLDVRIGGGYRTARSFLRAGLVDELHLLVAPLFLGRGYRLWDDLTGFENTYTVTTEAAESGVVHVTLTR